MKIKKSSVTLFEKGTAEYVVAHGLRQRSRGRNPSMLYQGELNPRKAFQLAVDDFKMADQVDEKIAKVIVDAYIEGTILGQFLIE